MIIDNLIRTDIIEKYRKAESRLVLLDYDGTLVDFKPVPSQAIPSASLLHLLISLTEKPDTEVIIVTGRDHEDVDKLLGMLPLTIIAGHGAMIKENGIWKAEVSEDINWKDTIMPLLDQVTLSCSESFIEEKHFSLAWHYRKAELLSGFIHSRELISHLSRFIELYGLKILDGNKVVEIMNKEIGKGKAVKRLIDKKIYDLILSIGDDRTDEEIFELFRTAENAVTIKVGDGNSFARYMFNSVSEVILFLKNLSE